MMKKFKNMTKKAKMIITVVFAVALIVSGAGITLYAQDINNKVEQTQKLYWTMSVEQSKTYNASEQSEYEALLEQRENAFNTLDVSKLEQLIDEFARLDNAVKERVKQEELQKKYDARKKEVDAITIIGGANEAETGIFNARKQQVLTKITDKKPIEDIDKAIAELKATNTDIQNRIDAERIAEEQASYNTGGSSYDDYYNDYPTGSGSGGSSGGSDGSGSGSGGSGGDTGGSGGGGFCPWGPGGSTEWGSEWTCN